MKPPFGRIIRPRGSIPGRLAVPRPRLHAAITITFVNPKIRYQPMHAEMRIFIKKKQTATFQLSQNSDVAYGVADRNGAV